MALLRVEALSKRYRLGTKIPRDIWALRDVSFDVASGTVLGVIGPNGAGKTTLLKIIARVTPPTKGRVVGHGRVIPLLALGAGFQAELSGRENVYMNAAMYGIAARDVDARMDEIIEFAGLQDFIEAPVKRLSSGMYLRLAFSVAINMRPDILLADEVLAVGDLEFQEKCLERVREAGESGMGVLFVSHDMETIRRICHRVLWLNSGEVVKIGEPEEITAEYESSAWALIGRQHSRKKGSHVSAAAEILFTRLTTVNGKEIGAARASDDMVIEIGVRAKQAGVRLRPQIDVHTRNVLAFRAVHPELVEILEPKDLLVTVRIPGHLLAETVYSIDVLVAAVRGEENLSIVQHNALAFQVFDPQERTSARGTYTGRLLGVVRPRLDWKIGTARR